MIAHKSAKQDAGARRIIPEKTAQSHAHTAGQPARPAHDDRTTRSEPVDVAGRSS